MPDREGVQAVKGGPSGAAIKAARDNVLGRGTTGDAARRALTAAHDPALGLDRSVRLGDVVEFLEWNAERCATKEAAYFNRALAKRIAREFGATTHAD